MLSNVYCFKRYAVGIDNGCIYVNPANEENVELDADKLSSLVDEFLEVYNASAAGSKYVPAVEQFISKYGLLSKEEYKKAFVKRQSGFVCVGTLKDYTEAISEIKFLRYALPFFKKNALEGCEDSEWLLNEYMKDINAYLSEVSFLVAYDKDFNLYKKCVYPSLKHLIYSKLTDDIIQGRTPMLCERCGAIISYRHNKKYCSKCGPTARKERYKNSRPDPIKDAIHESVYNRLHYRFRTSKGRLGVFVKGLANIKNNYNGNEYYIELLKYCNEILGEEVTVEINKLIESKKKNNPE